MSSIQIERLSADDYVVRDDLFYLDTRELHPLYEKIAFHCTAVLAGAPGIGKSISVASFCAKKKYPVITFDCSEDVRRSHLLGMFIPQGDRTPFVLGPLTTAFEIANERGHCVLILEELNSLVPTVQKVLNGATDFRRSVEVPECKRVFRLNPEAKLWVVGTMNNSGTGGVYSLNEDLKSRVRMLTIDYPKKADEHKIVSEALHRQKVPADSVLLDKLLTLAQESRAGAFEYSLSTRDLVQIMEDIHRVGLHRAMWLVSGKFEGTDRATILQRIESVLNVGKRLIAAVGTTKLQ